MHVTPKEITTDENYHLMGLLDFYTLEDYRITRSTNLSFARRRFELTAPAPNYQAIFPEPEYSPTQILHFPFSPFEDYALNGYYICPLSYEPPQDVPILNCTIEEQAAFELNNPVARLPDSDEDP